MKPIRRLSPQEASEKATLIARQLAESTDMKGWNWQLDISTPDPINLESVGKIPRYWICPVNYDREGAILDGPALIRIDLQSETASWLDR